MLSQYAASVRTALPAASDGHPSVQQYANPRFDQRSTARARSPLGSPTEVRHRPYDRAGMEASKARKVPGIDGGNESKDSASVRRRISRACDQCNQLRTKCNGDTPCVHCVEFGLSCEYKRQRKKRGKASRKTVTQHGATRSAYGQAQSLQDHSSDGPSPTQPTTAHIVRSPSNHGSLDQNGPLSVVSRPIGPMVPDENHRAILESPAEGVSPNRDIEGRQKPTIGTSMQLFSDSHQRLPQLDPMPSLARDPSIASPSVVSLNGFSISSIHDRPGMYGARQGGDHSTHSGSSLAPGQPVNNAGLQLGNGDGYVAISPRGNQAPSPGFRFGSIGGSPFPNFFNNSSPMVGSPGWLNLPSPSAFQGIAHQASSLRSLRYPVLQPLLPYIESVLPIPLACDLLELYFASSSSTYMHPMSPYVIGYVFRKQSFLKAVRPRPCSPALLASMLWLAAQTSDSSFLTSPPSARGRVCQKLMEITVTLLKPLMHGPQVGEASTDGASNSIVNGVALGGLGVAMTGGEQLTAESGGAGPLDLVATYIHLATIVSASEYKAASMRWWNAAWSFARELRLNRELPDNTSESEHPREGDRGLEDPLAHRFSASSMPIDTTGSPSNSLSGFINEEEREERRRVWWLLYTIDRHLSLCYNKPLFLLDAECESLFQPMNENDWQSGSFRSSGPSSGSAEYRPRGPALVCTGHGIFGFFTPLMVILGEIVDLNQARAHPRFGQRSRHATELDGREADIVSRLQAYAQSLKDFETLHMNAATDAGHGSGSSIQPQAAGNRNMSDAAIQTKIVVAYGTHVMHVFHILATGKWDPIILLDDNDHWISSQSFITAMGHAVSAADAIADILEYDPAMSHMPWFFGISLLQGSFLLLLIADKLGSEADPAVVKACENIVRAHEVCVVTLNTEYQRHMRKVMRSALAQVKGRVPVDFGEQQSRRREVLSLYRWTGDGTGLAL